MISILAWHDFKLLLKDKKAMAILLLMPMVLMTILGTSLASSFGTEVLRDPIPVAIVKQYESESVTDNWFNALGDYLPKETGVELTALSKNIDFEGIFFDEFLESESIKAWLRYTVMNDREAKEALQSGQVTAVLYLPEDFIKDTSISMMLPLRNRTEPLLVLARDQGFKGTLLKSIFDSFFQDINRRIAAKETFSEVLALHSNQVPDYTAMGQVLENLLASNMDDMITIETKGLSGIKSIDSLAYYAAAMMSMFLLFTAGQGGRMFLEEKEQFTLQRQLVTGLNLWQVLCSKFLTLLGISLTQIVTMVFYSAVVLGVDWGRLNQTIVIACFAALAVSGMGVFVGVITYKMDNYKLANVMESFIIQVMAFIGGSFIPLSVLPGFINLLSHFTINGLALKALFRTMQGFGYSSFLLYIALLAGIAVLFVVAAVGVLKKGRTVVHD